MSRYRLFFSPMMEMSILVSAVGIVVVAALSLFFRDRNRNLPPGPRGLPILQNILDLPSRYMWLVYDGWARKYGNIFSFRVLGHTYIVLTSARDVREVLVKRGNQCAGRMKYIMYEYAGWENDVHLVSPAGLRIMKQFATQHIGPVARSSFIDAVDFEVTGCIRRMLLHSGPVNPTTHARRMTGSVILRIAYGYEVKSDEDEFVKLSEQSLAIALDLVSPGWIIDMLPWTRHLPDWMHGPKFVRTVARSRELVDAIRNKPMDWVKQEMSSGSAKPSLAAEILSAHEQEDNKLLFPLLADFYAAGVDTTLSTVLTLLLMLAVFPDVQAKAKAEVDSVTHGERLPKFSDRDQLPYVAALIKELYRFPGVLCTGFPHKVTQAFEYDGYIFPKDSLVSANIWSILRDPVKYPEPFKFNPERYLGEEVNTFGPDDIVNEDPTRYIFGFEPRRCLGRHIVDSTLFLLAAKLLAMCDISHAVDEGGNAITPSNIQYTGDFISRPCQYTCIIRQRPNIDIHLASEQDD